MELIELDSTEKVGINQVFVKMAPSKLFYFYLLMLEVNSEAQENRFSNIFRDVKFDEDDTYSINFTYFSQESKNRIHMAMDFYQKSEEKSNEPFTVINFRKTRGCRMKY